MISWNLVTGPTLEPISLTEAKQHARITQTTDDQVISRFISAAREEAEHYMSRGLLTQTWALSLEWFADVMFLPRAAPLQNDAVAVPSTAPVIQYYDAAGTQQTLASTVYDVDTTSRPGRIVRKHGQTWPTVQADRRGPRVTITYVIGWTSPALVPERIKQGIRLFVTYLDADRDGMEQYAKRARESAEACWSDRVSWIEPCGDESVWPVPVP